MGNRRELQRGQRIALSVSEDGHAPEEYVIQSVAGRGGSTICYEAVRTRDGAVGKLKEFYPASGAGRYFSMLRLENGQLVPGGGTVREFRRLCGEYLENYRMLNQVIGSNPKNRLLKNYIPSGDILYGSVDGLSEQEGREGTTVYIWTPGMAGECFDRYLETVRSKPGQKPEQKLHAILNTMVTLTDCVKALHTAGLLHLDIKPSNFLVPYDSEFSLNTGIISMFDINTLYSVDGALPSFAGTPGFCAPEVLAPGRRRHIDYHADIYSIGAMLHYALVVHDMVPDGIYRPECYEQLHQLVRNSALIQASEARSDTRLLSRITAILRRCLNANPENRYDGCGELLEDLKAAALMASQYAVSPRLTGQNKRLALVQVDEKGISDPSIVMRRLLHDHPLYACADSEKRQIRVLVAGSGIFGQKFIDIALEAGQIKDFSLQIDAVSASPEADRESYLEFRPALKQFVNVDGSMAGDSRAYGTLNFSALGGTRDAAFVRELSREKAEHNRLLVQRCLEKARQEGTAYHYIFIALGNNRLNRAVAKHFDALAPEGCPVCYVDDSLRKTPRLRPGARMIPVCTGIPTTPETIDPQLEQMAFNTHMIWNSGLNNDITAAFRDFRSSQYNFDASLAYALSIRYKLFSIGIPVSGDLGQAAEMFRTTVLDRLDSDPEARKKFNTLVWLEHRRWVISKAAEGWTAPACEDGKMQLDWCLRSCATRDKVAMIHPCMVFSTEETPLKERAYLINGREKWDEAEIDPSLDPLDRLSLELHRLFRKAADSIDAAQLMQSGEMTALERTLADAGQESERVFRSYRYCLKNILNGVESYTRQYDYYASRIVSAAAELSADARERVNASLSSLRRRLYPVLEANLYRDYKSYDEDLVREIPYIVSFRYAPSLALAFEDGAAQNGRNQEVFANVASATVLHPAKISYLYCFTENSRLDIFRRKISAVLRYLNSRSLHCSISFGVACTAAVSDEDRAGLEKVLHDARESASGTARLESYEIMDCAFTLDASDRLMDYLRAREPALYDGSTRLFRSGLESGMFSRRLLESEIPYFEFDPNTRTFPIRVGCDYLRYLRDRSSIRVTDMFALMDAADVSLRFPDFEEDYETLWDIYTGGRLPGSQYPFTDGVKNWNRLCEILNAWDADLDSTVVIPLQEEGNGAMTRMTFILPIYTMPTVRRLTEQLAELGAVGREYTLTGYAGQSCRLVLQAPVTVQSQIKAVFRQPQFLMDYYGVRAFRYGSGAAVQYDRLDVEQVNLEVPGMGKPQYLYDLLEQLEQENFISGLTRDRQNPNVVSFLYSSPRIKKLLTNAGEILEIYTYFQVLKTGFFDDVVWSYEFRWGEGGVTNELDLVLTRGFRSFIVECKAVRKLDMAYYHKLHSIAEQFGIGTTKILIGNTYKEHEAAIHACNDLQRSRGEQLNIITISDEADIRNIGDVLADLMNR